MHRLLRAIRGAVVIGLLWAIPFAVVGFLAAPILRKLANAPPLGVLDSALSEMLRSALTVGQTGFLAGLAFSLVLSVAARRRTFQQLTTRQMLRWGITSILLLMGPPMILMLIMRSELSRWRLGDVAWLGGGLLLSAGCAVATLLLARRGAARGGEAIGSGSAHLIGEPAPNFSTPAAAEAPSPARKA